jgi:acetoin utilization deacetylase AcuC-like enzyme
MRTPPSAQIAAALRQAAPLHRHYEYCDLLGEAVARARPELWERFSRRRRPLASEQAEAFAFLRWLERGATGALVEDELERLLAEAIASGPSFLWGELEASLRPVARKRRVPARRVPEPADVMPALLAPADCLSSRAGYGSASWLEEALAGRTRLVASAPVARDELERVHERRYLRGLFALAAAGGGRLTPETAVTRSSERELRAAAGALLGSLEQALAGERLTLAYARPGSHHASRSRAGGTCLVNNLALAASAALERGLRRVAILDLDAHHGNGTEAIFLCSPQVVTCSVHQAAPFSPGTGSPRERGRGAGLGANRNITVEPGSSWSAAVAEACSWLSGFEPELLFLELSFDAHLADPASELEASDEEFALAGELVAGLARPVVCELGSSLSRRAYVGGLRSFLAGFARG